MIALSACTPHRDPVETFAPLTELPATWSTKIDSQVGTSGLQGFNNVPGLDRLVAQALEQNYGLAQQASTVTIAAETVRIVAADRWPALNLVLAGQRGRSDTSLPIGNRYDLAANLTLNLDLWRQLSDAQQQATYDYAASELRYTRSKRVLAADVAATYFNAVAAAHLETLVAQRLTNLEQALDVIERGYRSGLNDALDVYLAQNTVEQERANLANQRQSALDALSALNLLLGTYSVTPQGLSDQLPQVAPLDAIGVPQDAILRRADIQNAWMALLASDAGLAVAQKNQLPTLLASGSAGDTANSFTNLLDSGKLAWTAALSLTQPLFQGGRLRALSRQARAIVEQAEQRYLEVVYDALAEVETRLQRSVTLKQRLAAFEQAQANANNALTLAFDQYQRGLVTYTTVLEAQRRAFDAETTIVQLQNQIVNNRVDLLLALGGEYADTLH